VSVKPGALQQPNDANAPGHAAGVDERLSMSAVAKCGREHLAAMQRSARFQAIARRFAGTHRVRGARVPRGARRRAPTRRSEGRRRRAERRARGDRHPHGGDLPEAPADSGRPAAGRAGPSHAIVSVDVRRRIPTVAPDRRRRRRHMPGATNSKRVPTLFWMNASGRRAARACVARHPVQCAGTKTSGASSASASHVGPMIGSNAGPPR
jgi:hypothetical protein